MGTGRDLERRYAPPSERLSPASRRNAIEGQIEGLRSDLGDLIQEMERRGRRALSVRYQVRTHPWTITAVIAGAGLVVAGVVWLRARRRPPPLGFFERARLAVARRLVPERMRRREVWVLTDRRLKGVPITGEARAVVWAPRG